MNNSQVLNNNQAFNNTNDVIIMIKLNCESDYVYNNHITDEMLDTTNGYNIYVANVGSTVKNYIVNDKEVFHGKKYLNHKGKLYIENKDFIGKVDNELNRKDPKNFDQNPNFILATAKFRKLDYKNLGNFMQNNYNIYSQRGETNCIFVSYKRKYWFLYENKVILLVNNARKPFNVFEYTKHLGPIKEN